MENLVFSSVQFSRSVVSDSLRPHELQHDRPPCSSPTPGVYSNTCPSSRWCHPAISSSVVPFSSCPQSLPASGSFPVSQLFAWGGQSIGVSASASVLPMNTQDWSPFGWAGWMLGGHKRQKCCLDKAKEGISGQKDLMKILSQIDKKMETWKFQNMKWVKALAFV